MNVTLMLADSAQAVDGKLYILGGGWSATGPAPSPMAVAIKLELPRDQAGTQHSFRLQLTDADGTPVIVPTPHGEHPLEISGFFQTGPVQGPAEGPPVDFPMAINVAPLPIPAGKRYIWHFSIDDMTKDEWQVAFTMRAPKS